jgi:hypothetical protein
LIVRAPDTNAKENILLQNVQRAAYGATNPEGVIACSGDFLRGPGFLFFLSATLLPLGTTVFLVFAAFLFLSFALALLFRGFFAMKSFFPEFSDIARPGAGDGQAHRLGERRQGIETLRDVKAAIRTITGLRFFQGLA